MFGLAGKSLEKHEVNEDAAGYTGLLFSSCCGVSEPVSSGFLWTSQKEYCWLELLCLLCCLNKAILVIWAKTALNSDSRSCGVQLLTWSSHLGFGKGRLKYSGLQSSASLMQSSGELGADPVTTCVLPFSWLLQVAFSIFCASPVSSIYFFLRVLLLHFF